MEMVMDTTSTVGTKETASGGELGRDHGSLRSLANGEGQGVTPLAPFSMRFGNSQMNTGRSSEPVLRSREAAVSTTTLQWGCR